MHRNDSDLCPVKAWVSIVTRILAYENTDLNTYVNYVEVDGCPRHIESKDVMSVIRLTVSMIGPHELGFGPDSVGTHSIRSSFAMFLHLNKIPAEKIMLQGRWKSMAFIDYIRPQVSEFSRDLSRIMMQSNDFFTIPDEVPTHHTLTYVENVPLHSSQTAPNTLTVGQRYDQRMLRTPQRARLQHLLWICHPHISTRSYPVPFAE